MFLELIERARICALNIDQDTIDDGISFALDFRYRYRVLATFHFMSGFCNQEENESFNEISIQEFEPSLQADGFSFRWSIYSVPQLPIARLSYVGRTKIGF